MVQLADSANHMLSMEGLRNVILVPVAPISYIVYMHERMGKNNQTKQAPKSP